MAVSHRSAAWVWDLARAPSGALDLIAARNLRHRKGIRVHHSTTLDPLLDVVGEPDGLPVTTVARTLLDLAGVLTPHRLERAVHRAEQLRLLDATAIADCIRRNPGRKTRALDRGLATLAHAEPTITRSELEDRFLSLIDAHGLPRPQVNVRVGRHTVDFVWPEHHVIVETDGRATHLTARAFEDDRIRDDELQLAGYRVIRFTWAQVVHRPAYVARRLAAHLAAAPVA